MLKDPGCSDLPNHSFQGIHPSDRTSPSFLPLSSVSAPSPLKYMHFKGQLEGLLASLLQGWAQSLLGPSPGRCLSEALSVYVPVVGRRKWGVGCRTPMSHLKCTSRSLEQGSCEDDGAAVGPPGGYLWLETGLLPPHQSMAQSDPAGLLPRPRSLQPTPTLPNPT